MGDPFDSQEFETPAIIDSSPRIEATLDQVRQTAREAISTKDRFLACWEEGGDVTYAMFAGSTGGDSIAFFAYCAARALQAFAAISECDVETAAKATLQIIGEAL